MPNNALNYEKKDYLGALSTLCKGCGHDSITAALVGTFFELSVDPEQIIKLSGIGCSSKTPNYFLNQSYGFNSVHGRMAALATGVHLSQPKAKLIGISGDGDTASIGLGGFLHLVRKNVPIVYVIANNGVYGLTKGQFSATSVENDQNKSLKVQNFPELDLLSLALSSGCEFIARGFSGNQKELKNIFTLALSHHGTSVIDIVSPCVAYGNKDEFSKSYAFSQEHRSPLHEIDIILDGKPFSESELNYSFTPHETVGHDNSSYEQTLLLLAKEKKSKTLHTGVLFTQGLRKPLFQTLKVHEKERFSTDLNTLRLTSNDLEQFNKEYRV